MILAQRNGLPRLIGSCGCLTGIIFTILGGFLFFSAFTSIFYPIGIVTFGLILIMLALINEGVFYIVENTEDILSESRKTNSLLKK